MSGLFALAKPYRIKAAHRRRRKCASGQSVQRYYDPGIGRFLSVDPVSADTVSGWNFNRYNYAANNPYKFTDPDGRVIQALWGAPIGAVIDIAAQKIANPNAPINWKSVGVSALVGAASGGIASVARVAAIRGTISVSQAVTRTAVANAALGAAGSAADSSVNGQTPSLQKMGVAAAANGVLSLGAGRVANSEAIRLQNMASVSPTSPQGIGIHIAETTAGSGGLAGVAATQGATSAGGRVANITTEVGSSVAQKKLEEKDKR